MGKLYVVGTPIGNLGDMSPRAIEILREVDFIAAEDTRVTRKLMTHFAIPTPMISYHEHNAKQTGAEILARLLGGESCGIVSDAGMPCISDPGEELVKLCAKHQVEVVVVPGPSAVISALAISGLSTQRFSFEGFLSMTPRKRKEHLSSLRDDPRTLAFYEAPHKLQATLRDMLETFGERNIALCREITKKFEEVQRTTLSEAITYHEEHAPRGEYVLLVEGAAPREEEIVPFDTAVTMVLTLSEDGLSLSHAAREVAGLTSHKRSDLYRRALEEKG